MKQYIALDAKEIQMIGDAVISAREEARDNYYSCEEEEDFKSCPDYLIQFKKLDKLLNRICRAQKTLFQKELKINKKGEETCKH